MVAPFLVKVSPRVSPVSYPKPQPVRHLGPTTPGLHPTELPPGGSHPFGSARYFTTLGQTLSWDASNPMDIRIIPNFIGESFCRPVCIKSECQSTYSFPRCLPDSPLNTITSLLFLFIPISVLAFASPPHGYSHLPRIENITSSKMSSSKSGVSPPSGPSLRTSSEKPGHTSHVEGSDSGVGELYAVTTAGELHREMSIRSIFMLGIGGGIGTALFVSIGGALNSAGPANLLLGFIAYNAFSLANINNSMAEMTTYMPISGSFIRLAGHWVDDALGFAGGWNFYIYLGLIVPFEISALSLVLSYWSPHIPAAAICAACTVLYM